MLVAIDRDASSYGHEVVLTASADVTLKLDALSDQIDLKDLRPAAVAEAIYEGDGCLEGTRLGFLATIDKWSAGNERSFWLCGKAGIGESTVSRTVAEKIPEQGVNAASSLFSKTTARQQDAKYFWLTIVQQLIDQIPTLK